MAEKKTLKLLTENELRRKYPGANRASILLPSDKTLWLPSRNLALNHQLGGGIPYGKIIETIGYESTGKSLMALDFAYVVQQLGGMVLYGDAERSFNSLWAQANELDPTLIELYEDNDIEGLSDWARDMIIHYRSILTHNEPILLIIDSLAGLETRDNILAEQSERKAEMGNRAKAIYTLYRMRNSLFANYGVCVMAINQVRERVGASLYEDATTTPGGAATKFYASQRVMLIRSRQIKGYTDDDGTFIQTDKPGKGRKIGQEIIIKTIKNKVGPPREAIRSEVYFTPEKFGYVGYSRYAGFLEVLKDKNLITQKSGRIYHKDDLICNGQDKFIPLLHTNDDLRALLIRRSKINTISRLRARLEEVNENLFPVRLKSKDNGVDE